MDMDMPQQPPIEILKSIFETACEIELFEQWQTVTYYQILKRPPSPGPGRHLKPFAAIAYHVCRLWREIIKSSSVFWVSEHPAITEETQINLNAEQDCDLDLDQRLCDYPRSSTSVDLFEKSFYPILPRLRILCLRLEDTDFACGVMESIARIHLPRLRVLILESYCFTQVQLDAPGLHYIRMDMRYRSQNLDKPSFQLSGTRIKKQGIMFSDVKALPDYPRTTLSSLTMLSLTIGPMDTSVSMGNRLSLPSLVKLSLSSIFPTIVRFLERIEAPVLQELGIESMLGMDVDGPSDGAQELVASPTTEEKQTFGFPALKVLTAWTSALALPYFLPYFSVGVLEKVEKLSLRIGSHMGNLVRPEANPLPRIRFLNLKELIVTISEALHPDITWCLQFFDFSAVTGRVRLSLQRCRPDGILLDLPLDQRVYAVTIDALWHVHVPSITSLELATSSTSILTKDLDWTKFPSRQAALRIENLQVVNLASLFCREEAPLRGLCPGIRKLSWKLSPDMTAVSDGVRTFAFPLWFPKLEVLEVICCFDRIDHRMKAELKLVSLFNTPSGQTLKRVELRCLKRELQEAAHILRDFLPTSVKLMTVELEAPVQT